MAEVLSQSEIDALLAAVSTGDVPTEESAPSVESSALEVKTDDWIAYDLTSQERISPGRFIGLTGIHDRFAQLYRASLTRLLKRNVTANVASIEYLHFGDHASTITIPSALNIFSVKNLKTNIIMQVGAKFAYAMVDAYYGGAERPYSKIGGRDQFTNIEMMMIKKLAMLAVSDLKDAWRPNFALDIEFSRIETNSNFVGFLHPQDNVAVVTIDIDFENLTGSIAFVLPLKSMDRISQALAINVGGHGDEEYDLWKAHWIKEIGDTEMNVRVELGSSPQTLNSLQTFKKGDVLILDREASGELPVLVEGQEKIMGMMGVCHGNQAIRITQILPPLPSLEAK